LTIPTIYTRQLSGGSGDGSLKGRTNSGGDSRTYSGGDRS